MQEMVTELWHEPYLTLNTRTYTYQERDNVNKGPRC